MKASGYFGRFSEETSPAHNKNSPPHPHRHHKRRPHEQQSMLIFVKTKTGKTLSVDVERADTIQTLKGKIQEREGVPPVQQNLVFAGKPLEDAKSLAGTCAGFCRID